MTTIGDFPKAGGGSLSSPRGKANMAVSVRPDANPNPFVQREAASRGWQ